VNDPSQTEYSPLINDSISPVLAVEAAAVSSVSGGSADEKFSTSSSYCQAAISPCTNDDSEASAVMLGAQPRTSLAAHQEASGDDTSGYSTAAPAETAVELDSSSVSPYQCAAVRYSSY